MKPIKKNTKISNLKYSGKIPHEIYFINILLDKIKNDKNISFLFMLYVDQYYPNYKWNTKDYSNTSFSVCFELSLQKRVIERKLLNDINTKPYQNALIFGDIVMDFAIRFLNCDYKNDDYKIIVSSKGNCNKTYKHELEDGYLLKKMSKVILNKNLTYEKLRVFPTIENDYEVNEIIELNDGSYQKIL